MIYIIHDNPEWLTCLKGQLNIKKIEFTDWDLGGDTKIFTEIDLNVEPPIGLFYNRVSPSSHTRGSRFSLEYSKLIITWLEKWNREVINGNQSLELELSKGKQIFELTKYGVQVPETYFASSNKQILEMSEKYFNCKCIVKHNRSGSGVGVKLINNKHELINYLLDPNYLEPIDGITLIQKYIESKNDNIIRVELIDTQFIYGVIVDTSNGFNLCPADSCDINKTKFKIINEFKQDIEKELIKKYTELAKNNNISVCGIEFITDKNGTPWTYDFNCNTNYNKLAEKNAGCPLKATLALLELFESKLKNI